MSAVVQLQSRRAVPTGPAPVAISAQVLDLAGRQRMLNQRAQAEVLGAVLGVPGDWETTLALLRETAGVFLRGGHVDLVPGAQDGRVVVPVPADEDHAVFEEQCAAIRALDAAARTFAATSPDSPEICARVAALRELGVRVHAAADGGARVYARLVQAQKDTADRRLQEVLAAMAQEATRLGADARAVQASARDVDGVAGNTSREVSVVSDAADQVSRCVQSVSVASEELAASIREISRNSSMAADAAASTSTATGEARARVARLAERAADIGRVLTLITTIARQTNLLALNATIEAARAGEAGRGFAVVASEVKELARATARATEEIGASLDAIRQESSVAVASVGAIGDAVRSVLDMTAVIASAVEEQTAATSEITISMSEATKGVNEVSTSLRDITNGAARAATAAESSLDLSGKMLGATGHLHDMIAEFRA